MKKRLITILMLLLPLCAFCDCICGPGGQCNCDDPCMAYICKLLSKECGECQDERFLVYDMKTDNYFFYDNGVLRKYDRLEDLKLSYHKTFKFKVVNFNRYLYKAEFSAGDVEFTSTPSPILSSFFLGTNGTANTSMDDVLKYAALASVDKYDNELYPDAAPGCTVIPHEKYDVFVAEMNGFRELYTTLLDKELEVFNLCQQKEWECCDEKHQNAKISDVQGKFNLMQAAYFDAKKELQTVITDKATVQTKLNNLGKAVNLCDSLHDRISITTDPRIKKALEKQRAKLDCEATDRSRTQLQCQLQRIAIAEGADEALEAFWVRVAKPSLEEMQSLVLFNNNILKENFSFTSPPIYPDGHVVTAKLHITPDVEKTGKISLRTPLKNVSSELSIRVKGKPHISFSTGFFIAPGKDLQEKTYTWQKQPLSGSTYANDSGYYKLVHSGYGTTPFGIAALMNCSVTGTPIGFSIGAGITTEKKPMPVYLAGISGIFGFKNQLLLTAGVAMKQVKTVKYDLYKDYTYLRTQAPGDVPDYGTDLKAGFLISLTYTPFGTQSGSKSEASSNRQEKTETKTETKKKDGE